MPASASKNFQAKCEELHQTQLALEATELALKAKDAQVQALKAALHSKDLELQVSALYCKHCDALPSCFFISRQQRSCLVRPLQRA
jgi:hypothetical protein